MLNLLQTSLRLVSQWIGYVSMHHNGCERFHRAASNCITSGEEETSLHLADNSNTARLLITKGANMNVEE